MQLSHIKKGGNFVYILKTKTLGIIDGPTGDMLDTVMKSHRYNYVLFLTSDGRPRIARVKSVYRDGKKLKLFGYTRPNTNHNVRAERPFTAHYDVIEKTGYLQFTTTRQIAKSELT